VLIVDASLVGAQQPALAQRCDPVHRGKQFVRVVPGAVDRVGFVDEPVPAGLRVAGPAVGDERGTRLHSVDQERAQGRRGRVIDHAHPGPPVAARLVKFDRHHHQRLAQRTAPRGLGPAKPELWVKFVSVGSASCGEPVLVEQVVAGVLVGQGGTVQWACVGGVGQVGQPSRQESVVDAGEEHGGA